jgi:dTDP-4-dehydrorhamnose 3,5-epimerase
MNVHIRIRAVKMAEFTFEQTKLEGCIIVTPQIFKDARGYFMEIYQKEKFESAGIPADFVQDNQSKSSKGVLRGMHFQKEKPQGKLVRAISGSVFDVAVDLRPDSKTFKQWVGVELSAENGKQLFVPKGFAHGFLVLTETAEFNYKCTDYYAPQDEGGLFYADEDIKINWPDIGREYVLSEKDQNAKRANEQTFDYFLGR